MKWLLISFLLFPSSEIKSGKDSDFFLETIEAVDLHQEFNDTIPVVFLYFQPDGCALCDVYFLRLFEHLEDSGLIHQVIAFHPDLPEKIVNHYLSEKQLNSFQSQINMVSFKVVQNLNSPPKLNPKIFYLLDPKTRHLKIINIEEGVDLKAILATLSEGF